MNNGPYTENSLKIFCRLNYILGTRIPGYTTISRSAIIYNLIQNTPRISEYQFKPEPASNPGSSRPNSSANQTITQCGDLDRPNRVLRTKYYYHQARRPRSRSTPTEDEFLNIRTGTYDHLLHPQDLERASTTKGTSTSINHDTNLPQISQHQTLNPDTASDIGRTTKEHEA